MDDFDLMRIRADTLFTHDVRGRMVCSNEPEGHPAPRLFLGRTTGGSVVRFGETVPDTGVRQLAEIVDHHPPGPGLHTQPATLAEVREVLEQHGPGTGVGGGPAYRFPELIMRPSDVVQVTPANLDVVRDTYPWLVGELDDWWPCFAVVRDGAAVSICFSARIGADACEAGVDTLPRFRGHGYAAAVTAAWAASIREGGRLPLYSTAWENLASQHVARRLGLIMFGADTTWS